MVSAWNTVGDTVGTPFSFILNEGMQTGIQGARVGFAPKCPQEDRYMNEEGVFYEQSG